jgi:hypothetical protein
MSKKKSRNIGVLYIRLIPENIKNYFRAYCVKRGKTMREVIIDFMKQTIKDAQKADRQFDNEE